MSLHYYRRIRLGPLPVWLNITRSSRGWSHSWSVRVLGVTHNSWSGRDTVDLPGRWSWRSQ